MTGPLAQQIATEQFWQKVDRSGPEECWPWTGSLSGGGYGRFKIGPRSTAAAHRIAYELKVGPIPEGLTLDHLCRNRRCCNPAHLEPVTNRVNTLRGEGPTAQNARRMFCGKGHPLYGDNLRITPKGYRRCRACHRQWDKEKRARQVAAGERLGCDTCPGCGGPKKTQASRCRSCYVAARRAEEHVEWESHEGMVTVYFQDGRYAGCMGVERWQRLLDEDAALSAGGEGGAPTNE